MANRGTTKPFIGDKRHDTLHEHAREKRRERISGAMLMLYNFVEALVDVLEMRELSSLALEGGKLVVTLCNS